MEWPEIASIVAVIVSLLSIGWQVVTYFRRQMPALFMDIKTYTGSASDPNEKEKRPVMVKCILGNTGKQKLLIREAKMIIDEGTFDIESNEITYPLLWQWKKRCPDCELSVWFQSSRPNEYPGYISEAEIEGKYTSCSDLIYFVKAMEYLLPDEKFSDTKVIYLDESKFYRITFIVIPHPIRFLFFFKRKVDCLCVTAQIPAGALTEVGG